MDRKIYLVRHGKIDSGEKKCYIGGSTNLPLSHEGLKQVGKLKEFFRMIDIEKVYVSPLKRCLQTCEMILNGKNPAGIIIEDFKEINMGAWEGKSFDEIKEHFPKQFEERGRHIDTFIPPLGESFEMLQKRVMPAFENIMNITSGNILIVAHAGVNRVILSKILDLHLSELLHVKQPYGCINELFLDNIQQKWQCETINVNDILITTR